MKRFLCEILKFSLITLLGAGILVLSTTLMEKQFTSFKIPEEKTVLVVGDSKVETAVNDEILPEVFNFSKSGTAYFYSYLKIRKMLEDNPHLDTLVVGYSYGDLAQERDEWFRGEKYIKGKLRDHLFLMDFEDFYAIFRTNPLDVSISLFPIRLVTSRSNPTLDRWGSYFHLERDKLEEAKQRNPENSDEEQLVYSRYQEEYLLKIYQLALEYDLELILLTTPIHPLLEESQEKYKDHFWTFLEENLPEATLINHSDLPIPEEGFGDLGHLNYQGARIYSNYLLENSILLP